MKKKYAIFEINQHASFFTAEDTQFGKHEVGLNAIRQVGDVHRIDILAENQLEEILKTANDGQLFIILPVYLRATPSEPNRL